MGSPFASDHTLTVPLPFDAPQTITIRKLTGREVELAQAEHRQNVAMGRDGRGWVDKFLRVVKQGLPGDALAQKLLADPLAGYDRLSVTRAGLTAWTYDKPVTPETVADLIDEALEFYATEIMRLTKPWLFQTPDEAEAARKNA